MEAMDSVEELYNNVGPQAHIPGRLDAYQASAKVPRRACSMRTAIEPLTIMIRCGKCWFQCIQVGFFFRVNTRQAMTLSGRSAMVSPGSNVIWTPLMSHPSTCSVTHSLTNSLIDSEVSLGCLLPAQRLETLSVRNHLNGAWGPFCQTL